MGEVVENNLFTDNVTNTAIIGGVATSRDTIATYNQYYNSNTSVIGGEAIPWPANVGESEGVYWLATKSCAIATGSTQYLPDTDFWGNAYTDLPYIGAYPYFDKLQPATYRTATTSLGWYRAWGYGYPPAGGKEDYGPDFWTF